MQITKKCINKTMNPIFRNKILLLITILLIMVSVFSQTTEPTNNWDNQLYIGNKVAVNKNNWRYSGEIQVRLKNNTQSLDNYFIEGVSSYLLSKKWEIISDFRISVKPTEFEFRPGFGVVNKLILGNLQIVNQVKWQLDFDTKGNVDNGFRYAVFFNYLIHEKYIPNFAAGFFYRWQDDFQGWRFIRFGPGMAYLINTKHTINFNYLMSMSNDGQNWSWAGIPVVQLII